MTLNAIPSPVAAQVLTSNERPGNQTPPARSAPDVEQSERAFPQDEVEVRFQPAEVDGSNPAAPNTKGQPNAASADTNGGNTPPADNPFAESQNGTGQREAPFSGFEARQLPPGSQLDLTI